MREITLNFGSYFLLLVGIVLYVGLGVVFAEMFGYLVRRFTE